MKVAIVILTVLVAVEAKGSISNSYVKGRIKDLKFIGKPVEVPEGAQLKVIEVPPLALSCLCGEVKGDACSNKNKNIVYLDASEFKEGWPSDLSEADPIVKPTAKPTAKPKAKPTAKPKAKLSAKSTPKPTAKPKAKPTAKPKAKPTAKPYKDKWTSG